MSLQELLQSTGAQDADFPVRLLPGAELETIVRTEQRLKIRFPNDLVTFYLLTNGLEGDDLIFNIKPLDELTKQVDQFGAYLEFADYMINSEVCGVEVTTTNDGYRLFVHQDNGAGMVHRNYVANSLEDFISLFMLHGAMGIWGAKDGS